MIDPHTIVRDHILDSVAVQARVGSRVYAGRSNPPPGYKIEDGECICIKVRGGQADYDDALLNPSIQVKYYGASEADAYAGYLVLYDALQNSRGASVLHCEAETAGVPLEEPATQWRYVLGFFKFMLRQA